MKLIKKYFPKIKPEQLAAFERLNKIFPDKNNAVNMISRKDIENFEERHILHSLAIAKYIDFKSQTKILDVGTGGGFPGIPLAIMFPDCQFHLVDSIGKKINMVNEIIVDLELENVTATHARVESLKLQVDFVVSRAVAPILDIYRWTHKHIITDNYNDKPNGYLLLKGGNLIPEKNEFYAATARKFKAYEIPLDIYFQEEFFETKKLIAIAKK